MRMVKILAFALVYCCSVVAQQTVKDSAKAIKIAEKALTRIYGKRHIESERPFEAKLEDGVWTVSGTLRCKDARSKPSNGCRGGVAVAQISAADGRVISTQHTK